METNRRRLLKFLAGSPLLYPAAVAASAWQSGQRLDPIIDAASQALNVFDFEAVARERLSIAHFGYLATGSDDDGTLRANREGFTRFQLRVRRLVDVREIDMSVKLFGGYMVESHHPGPGRHPAGVSRGRRNRLRARRGRRQASADALDTNLDGDRRGQQGARRARLVSAVPDRSVERHARARQAGAGVRMPGPRVDGRSAGRFQP